jgi:hypothetical protein
MSYYSGNSGSIQFANENQVTGSETGWQDSQPVKITDWTMNTSVQLLETTTLGDWDRTTEYGIRSHTGSMTLLYYTADASQSSPTNNAASWFIGALTMASNQNGAAALGQYPDNGDFKQSNSSINVRLRLFLRSVSSTTRDYVDFDARLTSVSYGSTVNEITSVNVNFEASGQLLFCNL